MIGTNAVRRAAYLRRLFPDATVIHYRGAPTRGSQSSIAATNSGCPMAARSGRPMRCHGALRSRAHRHDRAHCA